MDLYADLACSIYVLGFCCYVFCIAKLFWVNFMLSDNAASRVVHVGLLTSSVCLWLYVLLYVGVFLKALFSFPFLLYVLNVLFFFLPCVNG